MKRRIYLLIVAAAGIVCGCQEKDALQVTGNIEGTVTDYETTQAIPGVMVDIVANAGTTFAKQSRQTGNDGKFAFKDLEAGNYKLSFSRSGYSENNQDVNLIAGQTVSSDVRLTPASPFKVQNGMLVSYSGNGGNVVIPDNLGITAIGNDVFENNSSLVSITIPAGVLSIGNDTFLRCKNLTSVILPNTLRTIGSSAFDYCEKLTTVAIPNSVTSIGAYAFFLSGLVSVTLGSGITAIGDDAFSSTELNSVTVSWVVPLSINRNVFADVYIGDATLRVPVGRKAVYQAAGVWSLFKTIVEY
ncbi:MAG: leucine-rich repeat protein [Prevotellaceae bacterium]|jgi:hypothetical protein|nr:leucine-rich repeat protein [Prevotellaceae bacterium]